MFHMWQREVLARRMIDLMFSVLAVDKGEESEGRKSKKAIRKKKV